MAKWSFQCIDNSGKRQCFTVTAPDKPTAIEKAFQKAKRMPKAIYHRIGNAGWSRHNVSRETILGDGNISQIFYFGT